MSNLADNNRFSVVLVGAWSALEFRDIRAWWLAHGSVTVHESLAGWLATGPDRSLPPLLLVLAQARPWQYSDAVLREVWQRFPLLPVVAVTGSWCEAETRSAVPLAGVWRIPWTHATARFQSEWERWLSGACPSWSGAVTATDDDRDRGAWADPPSLPLAAPIGVVSACTEMTDALVRLVREAGGVGFAWSGRTTDLLPGTAALIWDDMASPRGPRRDWSAVREAAGGLPIVALVDFPRADDYQRLRQHHTTIVLAKPFRAADLLGELQRATTVAPLVTNHRA